MHRLGRAGLAILVFGTLGLFLAWLVMGPADRTVELAFAEALRDARTRAVDSGRPHLLVLTSSTMEIREEGDERVLRGMSIPGATLLKGPAWIRVHPTGSAQFPASFFGGPRADTGFGSMGPNPLPPGDVVFSLSGGGRFVGIFLDLASSRVDQAYRYVDEEPLLSRLFSRYTVD